jgi:hypothetical protein
MSVGVTKDYKLKVRNLHASHTLGCFEIVVYYESIKREPKIRGIYECRCDERLQTEIVCPFNFLSLKMDEGFLKPIFVDYNSFCTKVASTGLRRRKSPNMSIFLACSRLSAPA